MGGKRRPPAGGGGGPPPRGGGRGGHLRPPCQTSRSVGRPERDAVERHEPEASAVADDPRRQGRANRIHGVLVGGDRDRSAWCGDEKLSVVRAVVRRQREDG